MKGTCKNCNRPTPGRWICDDCFPYYDGERFLSTPEEIGIVFDEDEDEED